MSIDTLQCLANIRIHSLSLKDKNPRRWPSHGNNADEEEEEDPVNEPELEDFARGVAEQQGEEQPSIARNIRDLNRDRHYFSYMENITFVESESYYSQYVIEHNLNEESSESEAEAEAAEDEDSDGNGENIESVVDNIMGQI